MITKLKLANFRVFNDEVTVRFRPITILIGNNNAGKSSIIKFLLMLQQSASNTYGDGFLMTNGDAVNLGSLYELKNSLSKKRHLRFSLEVSPKGTSKDFVYQYLSQQGISTISKHITEATIQYNPTNAFIGKEHKISSFSEEKNIQECKADITPSSVFLELENDDRNNPIHEQCIESIKYDLQSLRYLSAMREELVARITTDSSASRGRVGKKGEDTILQLWKSDILKEKYKTEFFDTHVKKVLGIDDIKFIGLDRLAVCNARYIATGAPYISIADFGFGVSQCLPVFVQGLLMPPRTHLIVEQPEAQVHPTAQIEMGSFFVDLWRRRRVGSIIETHSDNMLLRIRNHIRKGDISKDDISIVYFHSEGGKATVANLDIQENGVIQEGLPMEFFGGDLLELLRADDNEAESDS